MKPQKLSTHLPLHLDEWIEPQFRVFSLVLFGVLLAHLAGLAFLQVKVPEAPVLAAPAVTATIYARGLKAPIWQGAVARPEFLLRYADPSDISRADVGALPHNMHAMDGLMPLPGRAGLALGAENKEVAARQSIGAPADLSTLSRSLFNRNPTRSLQRGVISTEMKVKAEAEGGPGRKQRVERQCILFDEALQGIKPEVLPSMEPLPVDQPLEGPSIFSVSIGRDGGLEAAFLYSSCGVEVLDQSAARMLRGLKFRAAKGEKKEVWGKVTFYWPQKASLPLLPPTESAVQGDKKDAELGDRFSF